MKVTESDNLKHRQLCLFEDYLQRVSAEQREYAEVCGSPKMTETDSIDTKHSAKERVNFGTAVYRTVRTVVWEVGYSNNG